MSNADDLKAAEQSFDAQAIPPKQSIVSFFLSAELDPAATAATGEGEAQYPVYRDVDYIGYKVKGEKDFVSTRAELEHQRQHPKEWAEYQKRKANPKTDIRYAPFATPAVVETLRGINIYTVEDFANYTGPMTDTLKEHQTWAARFLQWANKPRMRVVDGQMVAA